MALRCRGTVYEPAIAWCDSALAAAEGLEAGVDRNASMHLLGHAALNLNQVFAPAGIRLDVVGLVDACGSSTSGYVGDWTATEDSVRTRTSSECGRDYRLKSVVLVEVTFCAYPASVPDIVMTNIVARIPG